MAPVLSIKRPCALPKFKGEEFDIQRTANRVFSYNKTKAIL